jgi:VirE N-terminal domain
MNHTFNYYPANIKQSKPLGSVTLGRALHSIKFPKENIKETFEQIRIADEAGDIKLKGELKCKLYSFTPCVFVEGNRGYKSIKNFTGLLMLDFDHLETQTAIEFKEALFNEYSFIIAAWLSASKHGVRAVVSIPVCTSTDEFKSYFNAIANELSIYNGWDYAPKNCCLPLFLSYDPSLLQRTDYTTWTKKFIQAEPPIVKQYIINDKTSNVEKIIFAALQKISSAGHPILRATSFALGGYVSAGYIDENYSIQMINSMIDSHTYLSQKKEIYKSTAKQMILKGKSKPLYL